MAWEKIGGAFKKEKAALSEIDGKYFIERQLREWLGSEKVWCSSFAAGKASIRVGSAMLQQEVLLREYDLGLVVEKELGVKLKKLEIKR